MVTYLGLVLIKIESLWYSSRMSSWQTLPLVQAVKTVPNNAQGLSTKLVQGDSKPLHGLFIQFTTHSNQTQHYCFQFYFTNKLQYYLQSEHNGKRTNPSQIDF